MGYLIKPEHMNEETKRQLAHDARQLAHDALVGVPKILHLTIKSKYFYQILHGEKRLEYRKETPYWRSRLDKAIGAADGHYDEVHFRNGYHPSSPFMRVELLNVYKQDGEYVIVLGKVLEITNA